MAKVFQVVNGICYWQTPYRSISETVGKYPKDCLFVEAPDYVFESWGYQEVDAEGNELTGEARFIKPTPPEGWLYDDANGSFYPESEIGARLEKAQNSKQEENKRLLANFLENNPLTWTDGKQYGVTMEDQSEIQLNMTQYQVQIAAGIENPVLEWHAIKEKCVAWTYEEMTALALAISQYIYPWFQKMNDYKSQIFSATTVEEVEAIKLVYEEDTSNEQTTEETESVDETVSE